ncbi:MAG: hemerythrin domain-containing protein [Acidobacteria bacterium]|nr:hemerythrin domain-containing protein [Acidobacteriota bacterium]
MARSRGSIHHFMAEDHARLDALLRRAVAAPDQIDRVTYARFRAGLLKHIAMEEKILLPSCQRRRGGEPLPMAARLRLDHAALAALLVPTPNRTILRTIQSILAAHNALEEGAGGLYELCDRLAGADADAWLARLQAAPEVTVAPHVDSPRAMEALHQALARAGYNLADNTGGDSAMVGSEPGREG